MSESAILMPFVCKWLDVHSKPQYFETQEKLSNHVDEHINSYNSAYQGDPNYVCPWEGCKKHQSDIIKLEEHLRKHTRQRPFKCIICNSRFGSLNELNGHQSFVDSTGTNDDTLFDENENWNLGEVKDETNVLVKGKDNKDNIAKLSYRDALVKGGVNKNKNTKTFSDICYEHEAAVWDLFYKGIEAISLMPAKHPGDFDDYGVDDLPEGLSDFELNKLMWKSYRKNHKDSKAAEFICKGYELLEKGPNYSELDA